MTRMTIIRPTTPMISTIVASRPMSTIIRSEESEISILNGSPRGG